jgi:hypothetical protein
MRLLETLLAGGEWEGREILSREGVRHLLRPPRDGGGRELSSPLGWTVHAPPGGRHLEHRGGDETTRHVIRLYPGLGQATVVVARGPARTRGLARAVVTTGP